MQAATCYDAQRSQEAFSCHRCHLTQAVMSAREGDDDFYAGAKLTNGLSCDRKPVRNHATVAEQSAGNGIQ